MGVLYRMAKRKLILTALLSGIKRTTVNTTSTPGDTDTSLYVQFAAFRDFVFIRTSYNSQQIKLKGLLNRLFDPTLKRIQVVTISDVIRTNYLQGGIIAPGTEIVYLNQGKYLSSGGVLLSGQINVPIELIHKEGEIKAWVDYYIFFDKNYSITYF
jgi:hypothetical protein